jgi:hypothetical protein
MSLDTSLDGRQASAKVPMADVLVSQADDQAWVGGEHFFDGTQILVAVTWDTT